MGHGLSSPARVYVPPGVAVYTCAPPGFTTSTDEVLLIVRGLARTRQVMPDDQGLIADTSMSVLEDYIIAQMLSVPLADKTAVRVVIGDRTPVQVSLCGKPANCTPRRSHGPDCGGLLGLFPRAREIHLLSCQGTGRPAPTAAGLHLMGLSAAFMARQPGARAAFLSSLNPADLERLQSLPVFLAWQENSHLASFAADHGDNQFSYARYYQAQDPKVRELYSESPTMQMIEQKYRAGILSAHGRVHRIIAELYKYQPSGALDPVLLLSGLTAGQAATLCAVLDNYQPDFEDHDRQAIHQKRAKEAAALLKGHIGLLPEAVAEPGEAPGPASPQWLTDYQPLLDADLADELECVLVAGRCAFIPASRATPGVTAPGFIKVTVTAGPDGRLVNVPAAVDQPFRAGLQIMETESRGYLRPAYSGPAQGGPPGPAVPQPGSGASSDTDDPGEEFPEGAYIYWRTLATEPGPPEQLACHLDAGRCTFTELSEAAPGAIRVTVTVGPNYRQISIPASASPAFRDAFALMYAESSGYLIPIYFV